MSFTREFCTFTREFLHFTREFGAFTREFGSFTREFGVLLENSGHLLAGTYFPPQKKKKRHNGTSFLKLRQYGCAHQVAVHFSCHFSAFIDCPNDEALPSSCISGSENPFDIRSVFAIDGINFLIDCFYAKLS